MTEEEIRHIVNEEVKEHFKKKVLEKEAQIDPSIIAFLTEMSKSVSWFWKSGDNRFVFDGGASADSLRMVDHRDPSKELRHRAYTSSRFRPSLV